MDLTKLTEPVKDIVSPAKGSEEDARYEMLVALLSSGQIKIEADKWAEEDLKCLLAGKWMEEDPETADVFSMKLFDSPISTWDAKTVEEYKKTYKKNCRRYASVNALLIWTKVKFIIKKSLPIVVLVVIAFAIISKAKKK